MEDLIGVAVRVSVTYVYILALLRLSGKRTIGALSPVDLAVTFVVGDMFDDIFWGEVPLAKGLVGLGVLVVLHFLVNYATYRSQRFERLVSGEGVVLVRNGRFVAEGLRRERLSEEDACSLLRMQGEEDLSEIREARHEPSGSVSVLLKEEAKPADRRDVDLVRERAA